MLPPCFIFLYYQKSFSDISLISAVRFLRYGHLNEIHHERRTEIISPESLFRFQSQFLHQFIACVGNIIVHHVQQLANSFWNLPIVPIDLAGNITQLWTGGMF